MSKTVKIGIPQPYFPRGHATVWRDGCWRYADTGEKVEYSHQRPCIECGGWAWPGGNDSCIDWVPGAIGACCGHGGRSVRYVMVAPIGHPESINCCICPWCGELLVHQAKAYQHTCTGG